MQSLLESVGLGNLVPSPVNVPAAPALNLRNNARNNGVRRRLNLNAQHPPGGEPEMVEENITVAAAPEPMAMNVGVMSPSGNEPTVGGRRRKASRKASRKSRKAAKRSRKASRKAAKRSRKASRKGAKRN